VGKLVTELTFGAAGASSPNMLWFQSPQLRLVPLVT